MELTEFVEKMKVSMESYTDAKITVKCVVKNNGLHLIGLEFKDDSNVAPIIYMNNYYMAFCNGCTFKELTQQLIREYKKVRTDKYINIEPLLDYDNIKDRITCRLVNYEMNKCMLSDMPHVRYLDLAKIYVISLFAEDYISSEVKINYGMLQLWGKTTDEIDVIATENTEKLFTARIISMEEALREVMKNKESSNSMDKEVMAWLDDEDNNVVPLYIATNQYSQNGAIVMCYKNLLKDFADSIGSDVYILPSSVHELLLMKTSEQEFDALKNMVYEINRSDVMEKDQILSDNVYIYSREKDSIEIV